MNLQDEFKFKKNYVHIYLQKREPWITIHTIFTFKIFFQKNPKETWFESVKDPEYFKNRRLTKT